MTGIPSSLWVARRQRVVAEWAYSQASSEWCRLTPKYSLRAQKGHSSPLWMASVFLPRSVATQGRLAAMAFIGAFRSLDCEGRTKRLAVRLTRSFAEVSRWAVLTVRPVDCFVTAEGWTYQESKRDRNGDELEEHPDQRQFGLAFACRGAGRRRGWPVRGRRGHCRRGSIHDMVPHGPVRQEMDPVARSVEGNAEERERDTT